LLDWCRQLPVLLRSATHAKPDAEPDAKPDTLATRRHAVSDPKPDAQPDAKPNAKPDAVGCAENLRLLEPTLWLQLLGLHRSSQSCWVLQLREWLWLFRSCKFYVQQLQWLLARRPVRVQYRSVYLALLPGIGSHVLE